MISSLSNKCLSKKKLKLKKLYNLGSERIEKNLNLVKIIEDLRNLKDIVNLTIATSKIKYKAFNSKSHYINLDSEDDYLIEMNQRLAQSVS